MNHEQEHSHDLMELEREEALMEAEDIKQAVFDQQKADYMQELLTESVRTPGAHNCTFKNSAEVSVNFDTTSYPSVERYSSKFQWEVWQNWFDSLDNNVIELVRLNLAAGDREKAGTVLVESIEKYMDEIAARAVRERNNE